MRQALAKQMPQLGFFYPGVTEMQIGICGFARRNCGDKEKA